MSIETRTQAEEPQLASNKSFGLVFGVFFCIIFVLAVLEKVPGLPWWYLLASVFFFAAALLFSSVLSPLNRVWGAFGRLLHSLVSPLVLGALFFLLLTPMALLMRLFRADLLKLRFERERASYWVERTPPGPTPESLKDQF